MFQALSVVPSRIAAKIGIASDKQYLIIGFDEKQTVLNSARAEIEFAGRAFAGQFIIMNLELGIIGRDILNQGVLLLVGPKLQWEFT